MNGPTRVLAKLGDPAAPVSTIPFPLGDQPWHERWIPGVPVAPALHALPRSESSSSEAFAAVVPTAVCFSAGAAAAAGPASTAAARRTAGSFMCSHGSPVLRVYSFGVAS